MVDSHKTVLPLRTRKPVAISGSTIAAGWRVLLFLLLLTFNFGLSTPLFAQGGFTTVTGTITGAVDGIVWACGTISAQLVTAGGAGATLNGGGFTTQTSPVALGCPTSPGTGAPGSFAMRLADSGVIHPSNTTWRFTVNIAPGVAPPAGTGPQSFTFTSAINCSTNTPNTCTSNTIDISALLSALAPKLSNGGGGGGGAVPGAPLSSLQYNNSGAFGGTAFIYTASGTPAAPFIVSTNADGINHVEVDAGGSSGVGSGFFAVNQVTAGGGITDQANASFLQSFVSGVALVGGGCFVGGSGPACSAGLVTFSGDVPTDTNNGQDLVVYSAGISLNKPSGKNVNHFAQFLATTPFKCFPTDLSCTNPVVETAVRGYGLEVQDLGGFTTTDQAAIIIDPQTTPGSGTKFSIEALTGSGRASFGDGIALPSLTGTQCLHSISGVVSGTGSDCGSSGGSGTVTSFSAGSLSPLFTTSVATATTTPALTFTLSNAPANTLFGNFTSSPAAPTYSAAPALPNGTTCTTQAAGDSSGLCASDSFVTTAVNNAIAAVNPAVAVLAATTGSNITGTYSNGVGGVGATFTVTATGAFTLDGIAINTIGQRVLLKDQTSAFQNGIYTATVVGATGISPVFTRALDYDQPSDINSTGAIPVQSGTVNATTSWLLTSTVNTVGTDALTFVQFSIAPTKLVQAIANGTLVLGTSAIASGVCATVVTATATGALQSDTYKLSDNSGDWTAVTGYGVSATGAVLTIYPYITAGAMNIKVCNSTPSPITPAALTFNFTVTRP